MINLSLWSQRKSLPLDENYRTSEIEQTISWINWRGNTAQDLKELQGSSKKTKGKRFFRMDLQILRDQRQVQSRRTLRESLILFLRRRAVLFLRIDRLREVLQLILVLDLKMHQFLDCLHSLNNMDSKISNQLRFKQLFNSSNHRCLGIKDLLLDNNSSSHSLLNNNLLRLNSQSLIKDLILDKDSSLRFNNRLDNILKLAVHQ